MKKYLSSYTYFRLAFILYIFINTLALGYLGISNTFLSVIIIIWGIYWYVWYHFITCNNLKSKI